MDKNKMIEEALTFDDVLMVPRYCGINSRNDVDTSVKLGPYEFKIPIISANMDTITGSEMARRMYELGGLGILHRYMSPEDNVTEFVKAVLGGSIPPGQFTSPISFNVGVSIGVSEQQGRFHQLYGAGARIFCVDVAHGHSKLVNETISKIKREYPDVYIIAGNVATRDGVLYLRDCGADAVKVGIGPGSVCTTRIKTGVGVPQLSAIMDCVGCNVPIIADGGCRTPGDIAKALAAGADMVMLGGMLAGTTEVPGETITTYIQEGDMKLPQCKKVFRGMASREAFEDFFGAMPDWKTAEGVSTKVFSKGPIEMVLKDIMGGLRSAMTYNGATTLAELREKVKFVRVTHAGRVESGAHING